MENGKRYFMQRDWGWIGFRGTRKLSFNFKKQNDAVEGC